MITPRQLYRAFTAPCIQRSTQFSTRSFIMGSLTSKPQGTCAIDAAGCVRAGICGDALRHLQHRAPDPVQVAAEARKT
jgi:hypothetical protein